MRCVAEVNQKNPHGNRVFKTQFPSSSSFVLFLFFLHLPSFSFLSPSFFFFIFSICHPFLSQSAVPLPSSKPQKPKTVLPSSSKSISQNPNPNPFLKILNQKSIKKQKTKHTHQSKHRKDKKFPGLTAL